jgi:branched chain amino acid efflux pump
MRLPDRDITRDAVAIAVAVGVIGLSFGVIAVGRGVTPAEAQAMSLLVFSGGAQFVLVGGVGGGLAAALGSALLVNARHVAFGIAVAPVVGGPRWRRALASHIVLDESTAYALAQRDPRRMRQGFYAVGILLFLCWQAGTAVGALAGSAIDYRAFGIDAAFPAGLLAMTAPLLRTRQGRAAGAAGAAIALATTPLLPRGAPILLAVVGAAAGLAVGRPR